MILSTSKDRSKETETSREEETNWEEVQMKLPQIEIKEEGSWLTTSEKEPLKDASRTSEELVV